MLLKGDFIINMSIFPKLIYTEINSNQNSRWINFDELDKPLLKYAKKSKGL